MHYRIRIKDKTYDVVIEDLNARPIRVLVDGEPFEVMPEPGQDTAAAPHPPAVGLGIRGSESEDPILLAPLPGTVTEILVHPGDRVESGQPILIIEAMKMKNYLRAPRAGQIAAILVQPGQTVNHKQPLLEFA